MNDLTKAIEAALPHSKLITIEQKENKTVVTFEPETGELTTLPDLWYVENFDLATEWAKGLMPSKLGDLRSECSAINSDKYGFYPESFVNHGYTQITRQQFIDLVYMPWKKSHEKPLSPYEEPKFDPKTADKTKMYFAVHPEYGEGVVWYCVGKWYFDSAYDYTYDLSDCTYIHHSPIIDPRVFTPK